MGNNPGEVVTALAKSGRYAGYYYYTSPNTGSSGVTRDFWSIDWSGNQPKTLDFTVEGQFYVPKVTLTAWVSFISIHFNGYSTISIDAQPDGYPYLYNQMTPNWGFQDPNKKVQFPFDRWFKLAVEVHYKLPNSQPSEFILYMDDVKIIDQVEAVRYNTPTNLLALHFGVYNDNGQKQFTVYNDDLRLIDQSVPSTTLSTTTGTVTLTSQGSTSYETTTTTSYASTSTSSQPTSTSTTGLESPVVLLLGFDATQGSTSFPDSSPSNHVMTAEGDAHIDAAQSKFGGGSGRFDGSGDLTTPDSADWYWGAGDFTIDLWARFNALPAGGLEMTFWEQSGGAEITLGVRNNGGTYQWQIYVGSPTFTYQVNSNPNLATNTWYHVAYVRSGNSWYVFQDGLQCGTTGTLSGTLKDMTGSAYVGSGNGANYFNGWLDEFRVSKGLARWTSNFTPPSVSQLPITPTTTSGTTVVTQSTSSSTTSSQIGTTIAITGLSGTRSRVSVSGSLIDANGHGLQGMSVRILIDGRYVATVTTNSNGLFSFYTTVAPSSRGPHTVTVIFDGNSTYASSSVKRNYRN